MTSSLVRVYAVLVAVVAFFVTWAAVAAHPWRLENSDPRLSALAERRAQLQHEAAQARQVLARRYAAYRVALGRRQRRIARVQAVQARLDAHAKSAWAHYRASAPVRTVTVYTPGPAVPTPSVPASAPSAVLASAPAPSPTPAPAPALPPVVSIPAVAVTQTS